MNTDRLLREVEKRLAHLSDADRAEALDAVREEIGRERRRVSGAHSTVETERERRTEAETLREILEAINRQPSLDDTIEEVLKQLTRIVVCDSCSLGLLEADGSFRILASRGFPDPASIRGRMFQSPLHEALRHGRSPLALADVTTDERFAKEEGAEQIRSWAGIPLLVEGEVIGVLCLDRHRVEPFDEEDLHRAKAVAFSSAAAIRKAQLLDKVRRYASLMERVVNIDEAVFAGRTPAELARVHPGRGAAHRVLRRRRPHPGRGRRPAGRRPQRDLGRIGSARGPGPADATRAAARRDGVGGRLSVGGIRRPAAVPGAPEHAGRPRGHAGARRPRWRVPRRPLDGSLRLPRGHGLGLRGRPRPIPPLNLPPY
jgi:hypothetical protein